MLILAGTLLTACAATETARPQAVKPPPPATLEEVQAQRWLGLIAWLLEGEFETMVQPPGFMLGDGDNTPMRLRVARLWPEHPEEYWFYLEYVDPKDDSRVIRQRLTHGVREGSRALLIDYAFPADPKTFVGEWRKPHPFASVDPLKLKPLPGCRTFFIVQHDAIVGGGTETDDCRGDGPEGTHEHADWFLGSTHMRHFFRQLDRDGKPVGDGLTGPMQFTKLPPKPR